MSRINRPILFSKHFNVDSSNLKKNQLIDPFINVDTQLFIDPLLLSKSSNKIISSQAKERFHEHFSNLVRLLALSRKKSDTPWRSAEKLLDLREPPQNGLGYGGNDTSGSSRPKSVQQKILHTAKEIIDLGSSDPEMISLMGLFEEGVGPDTISDLTTRIILEDLGLITQLFCEKYEIETTKH